MTENTVIVGEPICVGREHVPFNSALLQGLLKAYPDASFVFFGESSHIGELKPQLTTDDASRIQWVEAAIPPRRTEFWARLVKEKRLLKAMLRACGDQGRLVLLSGSLATIALLKALLYLRRSPRTFVVLHSLLSEIVGWRSRNPFRSLTDARSIIGRFNLRQLQFLVLEEGIAEAAIAELPSIASHTSVVEHPILPGEWWDGPHAEKDRLRLVFLGLASAEKGIDYFLEAARVFGCGPDAAAEFQLIGRLPGRAPLAESDLAVISGNPGNDALDRGEYLRRLRAADYVCLPFSGVHYEYVASGVLLDAIASLKPVIAVRTTVIDRIEKTYGDIGYLCDSQAEFRSCVAEMLSRHDAMNYHRQVDNLRRARESRTIDQLRQRLADVIGPLRG